VLIIRMSKCIDTASGIVFCVSDRPVCTPKDHLPDAVSIHFDILMMSTVLLETHRRL